LAPATDPSGRWPVPPPAGDEWSEDVVVHPLFDGGRLLLSGHADAAVAPLREAVAQQRAGEGLLRSEAVALLIVALAATGQPAEARELLAASPPDRVALYCGLRPWAESAIEAAEGGPGAVGLAFRAYEEARTAGGAISAVAYLAAAARYGASAQAFAELERWGQTFESPICVARAIGIAARARGDGESLLRAAERHAELGLVGDAGELSALAHAALGRDRSAARPRAKDLCDEMRRRLRTTDTATPHVLVALTRRERETAVLAGRGMSDADIAATLVLSVRTVESHLASAYRKLGINSRRDLRYAL
jgi:DNA-binding CsgD family transcriptional regulator